MNRRKWKATEALWVKLKPLARQNRREPTPAEDALWQHLRNRQVGGLKFRRQHVIERFIVDFYCAEAHLIVEVDGSIHDYTPEQDAVRQEFLECLGFRVIRFTNDQVLGNIQAVVEQITRTMREPPPLCEAERGPGGEV